MIIDLLIAAGVLSGKQLIAHTSCMRSMLLHHHCCSTTTVVVVAVAVVLQSHC
jgi:hypothetical protein